MDDLVIGEVEDDKISIETEGARRWLHLRKEQTGRAKSEEEKKKKDLDPEE